MQFSTMIRITGNPEDDIEMAAGYVCYADVVKACQTAFGEAVVDLGEAGESEYNYLAEESDDEWWKGVRDISADGIIDRPTFTTLMESMEAWMEETETMGTLGGPLGLGITPDVSFTIESERLISCIRVTPIPDFPPNWERFDTEEAKQNYSMRCWNRIRAAMLEVYGV